VNYLISVLVLLGTLAQMRAALSDLGHGDVEAGMRLYHDRKATQGLRFFERRRELRRLRRQWPYDMRRRRGNLKWEFSGWCMVGSAALLNLMSLGGLTLG